MNGTLVLLDFPQVLTGNFWPPPFSSIFLASSLCYFQILSTPAHLSAIQTVSRLFPKQSWFYATLAIGMTITIQSSAKIGAVIRNAVVFNVRNWSGGTMNSDSLIPSVQDFFAILERREIDYVLVGGIAILHYVEGRNTQDLDLLMAVSAPEKLPELKISSQDMCFIRANYNELQIDVLLTQNPLFKKRRSLNTSGFSMATKCACATPTLSNARTPSKTPRAKSSKSTPPMTRPRAAATPPTGAKSNPPFTGFLPNTPPRPKCASTIGFSKAPTRKRATISCKI